jgi:DNA ligase-1
MYQEPTLAIDCLDIDKLTWPKMASPKFDGVRCTIEPSGATSRTGILIPNKYIQQMLRSPELLGMDGELIVGSPTTKTVFSDTMSGTMSVAGEPSFTFYVFDNRLDFDRPWRMRNSMVHRILRSHRGPVQAVLQTQVESAEDLMLYEDHIVGAGYEGVMLRDPQAAYKFGRCCTRTPWLLKVKRFTDSEAVILSVEEGSKNTNAAELDNLGRSKRSSSKAGKVPNGTFGRFHVQDIHTGVKFYMGTWLGSTAKHKADLWAQRDTLPGKILKYKFQAVGTKDAPRLPIILGFRDPMDFS